MVLRLEVRHGGVARTQEGRDRGAKTQMERVMERIRRGHDRPLDDDALFPRCHPSGGSASGEIRRVQAGRLSLVQHPDIQRGSQREVGRVTPVSAERALHSDGKHAGADHDIEGIIERTIRFKAQSSHPLVCAQEIKAALGHREQDAAAPGTAGASVCGVEEGRGLTLPVSIEVAGEEHDPWRGHHEIHPREDERCSGSRADVQPGGVRGIEQLARVEAGIDHESRR